MFQYLTLDGYIPITFVNLYIYIHVITFVVSTICCGIVSDIQFKMEYYVSIYITVYQIIENMYKLLKMASILTDRVKSEKERNKIKAFEQFMLMKMVAVLVNTGQTYQILKDDWYKVQTNLVFHPKEKNDSVANMCITY